MKRIFIIISALGVQAVILLVAPAVVQAQACWARLELPVGSLEQGGTESGTLVLGLNYEYSYLQREKEMQSDWSVLRAQTHIWTLDVSFGVNSWFTPTIILPFLLKTQKARIAGELTDRRSHGLGDTILLSKFTVWGHDTLNPQALRVFLTGGVKLPLGENVARDELGPLPSSFQVGSGSFDLLGGMYFSVGLTAEIFLYGSGLYRWTTENDQGYRFGNDFSGSVDIQVSYLWPLVLKGGLRTQLKAVDRQDGIELPNSEGWQLFGRVGAAIYPWSTISFNIETLIPVYQELDGNQMIPEVQIIGGVRIAIQLWRNTNGKLCAPMYKKTGEK